MNFINNICRVFDMTEYKPRYYMIIIIKKNQIKISKCVVYYTSLLDHAFILINKIKSK